MRRKILDTLWRWKNTENGRVALLIEGARRVGKSYIVEAFAREAYRSYIMIDPINWYETHKRPVNVQVLYGRYRTAYLTCL